MSELTSMMNIGKTMAAKLTSVGIDSPEKLIELGSEQAFLKLKQRYPHVCLVHLYALEGATQNVALSALSAPRRGELKAFGSRLKASAPPPDPSPAKSCLEEASIQVTE